MIRTSSIMMWLSRVINLLPSCRSMGRLCGYGGVSVDEEDFAREPRVAASLNLSVDTAQHHYA